MDKCGDVRPGHVVEDFSPPTCTLARGHAGEHSNGVWSWPRPGQSRQFVVVRSSGLQYARRYLRRPHSPEEREAYSVLSYRDYTLEREDASVFPSAASAAWMAGRDDVVEEVRHG